MFSVAYRLTGSVEDAEDVVQNAFLKAYKQLSRFEARADFKTWLHRITVNCAIDLIRSRHREVAQDLDDLESVAHRRRPTACCRGRSVCRSVRKSAIGCRKACRS